MKQRNNEIILVSTNKVRVNTFEDLICEDLDCGMCNIYSKKLLVCPVGLFVFDSILYGSCITGYLINEA